MADQLINQLLIPLSTELAESKGQQKQRAERKPGSEDGNDLSIKDIGDYYDHQNNHDHHYTSLIIISIILITV